MANSKRRASPPPSHINSRDDDNRSPFSLVLHDSKSTAKDTFFGMTFHCTVCSKQVNPHLKREFKPHPKLDVILCNDCHRFLQKGDWTKDEAGADEQCSWCGNGGTIYVCDKCKERSFCKNCIFKNFGRSFVSSLTENPSWSCFFCDDAPLEPLRQKCRMIMDNIAVQSQSRKSNHNSAKKAENGKRGRSDGVVPQNAKKLRTILRRLAEGAAKFSNFAFKMNDRIQGIHALDGTESEKLSEASKIRDRIHDALKNMNGFCVAVQKTMDTPLCVDVGKDSADYRILPKKRSADVNDDDDDFVQIISPASDKTSNDKSKKRKRARSVSDDSTGKRRRSDTVSPHRPATSQGATADDTSKPIETRTLSLKEIFEDEANKELAQSINSCAMDIDASASITRESPSVQSQGRPNSALATSKISNKEKTSKTTASSTSAPKAKKGEPSLKKDKSKADDDDSPENIDTPEDDLAAARKAFLDDLDDEDKEGGESRANGNVSDSEQSTVPLEQCSRRNTVEEESEKSDEDMGENDSESDDEEATERPKKRGNRKAKTANSVAPEGKDKKAEEKSKEEGFDPALERRLRAAGRLISQKIDATAGVTEKKSVEPKKKAPAEKKNKRRVLSSDSESSDDEIAEIISEDTEIKTEMAKSVAVSENESDPDLDLDAARAELLAELDSHSSSSDHSDGESKKTKNIPKKKPPLKAPLDDEKLIKILSSDDTDGDKDEEPKMDPKTVRLLKARIRTTAKKPSSTSNEDEANANKEENVQKKKPRKKNVVLSSDDDCVQAIGVMSGSDSEKESSSSGEEDDDASESKSSESTGDDDGPSTSAVKKKSKPKAPKKSVRRKRVAISRSSDSDEDKGSKKNTDEEEDTSPTKANQRRNIRKMLTAKSMKKTTLDAQAAERERRKRVAALQAEYNSAGASGTASGPGVSRLILEKGKHKGDVLVEVNPNIVKLLKPHQLDGIRFLYTSIIESVQNLDTPPGGCILAHCMGLGKTLQVIAFLHTLLMTPALKIRTALVVAPVNVVLNWKQEIEQWLGEVQNIQVFELASFKKNKDRAHTIRNWREDGGILIMGYNIFRCLLTSKDKKNPFRKDIESGLLNPGPDVVVCDEGHILKNEKTSIAKVMNMIRTPRRVCLTGTPLQNNLSEYHCMVQFVKPSLLGSKQEFKNRFENPIKNGQCVDSTQDDVRVMKRRAHVLHEILDGCVHRRDYTALTSVLPPRNEFILYVRLSEKQIELYRHYLATVVGDLDLDSLRARRNLFADFQAIQRICSHPLTLKLHQELADREAAKKEEENEEAAFIDDKEDESSAESEKQWSEVSDKLSGADGEGQNGAPPARRRTRQNPGSESDRALTPVELRGWWKSLLVDDDFSNLEHSGKFVLLMEILRKCQDIGDKVLVFSQSLRTLDAIEEFLAASVLADGEPTAALGWGWTFGKDYFRMDGSTSAHTRRTYIRSFNDPNNPRARLFLITTRAGSLGTNMVAANRVIIFDVSWNPSQDIQAIFRVYRYGQTKPVYIYRFVAQGTLEERIYDRQVTKESLALRVVDEQQIERHFLSSDLEALYKFEPDDKQAKEKRPMPAVPKDRLLGDLLLDKKDFISTYHEHDSLLQNIEDERLTEEEKQMAWNEYKQERDGRQMMPQMPQEMDVVTYACMMSPAIRELLTNANRMLQASGAGMASIDLGAMIVDWITEEPILMTDLKALYLKLLDVCQRIQDMVTARHHTALASMSLPNVHQPNMHRPQNPLLGFNSALARFPGFQGK